MGARPAAFSPTRTRFVPSSSCRKTISAPGKPPSRAPPGLRAFCMPPDKRSLDRRRGLIDVVAIKAEPGLETE